LHQIRSRFASSFPAKINDLHAPGGFAKLTSCTTSSASIC
jgi:hypothetical protein